MSDAESRRLEFAAFLRARRAALRPDEVGLPVTGRRRVPGLRREEVAQLASISPAWYTLLEQGNAGEPTAQVIDALAIALRFDDDTHRHFRGLVGLATEPPPHVSQTMDYRLEHLVRELEPVPAVVQTAWYDYLAWNSPFIQLFGVDPNTLVPEHRNGLWALFVESLSHPLEDRGSYEEDRVAQLRFGTAAYRDHPRFRELIDLLNENSPRFQALWRSHSVRRSIQRSSLRVIHPTVGPVNVERVQLTALDEPTYLVTIYVASSKADRARLLDLSR